jgi:hypothetical protein
MFLSKARAYPRAVPFRHSSLGRASGLTHKYQTRLERHAMDKHSIFFLFGQAPYLGQTNTLAYQGVRTLRIRNGFIVLAPGVIMDFVAGLQMSPL